MESSGSARADVLLSRSRAGSRALRYHQMGSSKAAPDMLGTSGSSMRGWTGSFREAWTSDSAQVFRHSIASTREEDEEDLLWAALEKLPTVSRMRRGVLKHELDDGKLVTNEVDLAALGFKDKKILVERIFRTVEEDNERFLKRLRQRIDTVGIDIPKIEVRFENLSVEGDAHAGSRALPTLLNFSINAVEALLGLFHIIKSKKRVNKILTNVSGILKPSRMTLLLGPPSSGKTTLLLALSGKLDNSLRLSGKITYCGHELTEFIPERTCAYISQNDLHIAEMTVRETLDFSGRCLGVGARYEMLEELSRREKEAGIKPDPEIDAFMKSSAIEGQENNLMTDYVLKILGLEGCADTVVGNEMRRGISGGQKKRVTTGEMLVGPAKAFFMDEISTGLDSSTTFQIVKFLKQMVHIMDGTMIVSLLQPAPETFELFDDIILLSEGQIVYEGPRENVLEFFEFAGFTCPERKGVADFLQEVTSKKDQEQYWSRRDQGYRYVSVNEFVQLFESFHVRKEIKEQLRIPYDKSKTHPAALSMKKYGISSWELFKACFSREWMLMKRNSFIYIFKTTQITVMSTICMTIFLRTEMHHETIADGGKFLGAIFFSLSNMMFNGMSEMSLTIHKLPIFYKQRDFLFYPSWAFALPIWLLRLPLSIVESFIWIIITYYGIGFAPAASRFFKTLLAFVSIHQMALGMFRLLGAVGRSMVLASTFGMFTLLVVIVLGGFVVSKDSIQPWWIWAYYGFPMSYGLNALSINEFTDERWNTPNTDNNIDAPTVGTAVLKSRGLYTESYWYWIAIGALLGFSLLYNFAFIAAVKFLNPIGNSHSVIDNEDEGDKFRKSPDDKEKSRRAAGITPVSNASLTDANIHMNPDQTSKKGMILPFEPHSLAFNHVNYYVDMPPNMKSQGVEEDRLRLLCDVSGAFRPGILTALVGVSGAGKSTLMDVLAGRKTGGYIEGSICVSGFPKIQATFARISGYCEQNDIHSPCVTVYESLVYSAWLRLPSDVNSETRLMFVEEVLELIELHQLRDALVGLPGVSGLSTEQRKRLTVAVELVANPSIIFMDEPTSGLDARAAAIVMRTVRNTVDTGRTVVCTIHQPSIDIFEAFDELLLMKTGGQVIYAGSLGRHSQKLIDYFEAIPGIPKIREGHNPATWMLEVSSAAVEAHLDLDFAEVYANSSLYEENQQLIKELSTAPPGSKDLYFPTKFSQSFSVQCLACFWKQNRSYWKNPAYNAARFVMTLTIGVLFGTVFLNKGQEIHKQQDLLNLLGAIYASLFFLGALSAMAVQPVVSIERTVFYRERAAGMYSELAYAFAQVSIEVIYVAIQSLMYALVVFSLIDFGWQADKFLWFLYFLFMSLMIFTLFGMMAIALTPAFQIAAIVMSFFFSMWNLFSGFLIYRPSIPIWWRWFYWASPVAWTIYGALVSQLGKNELTIEVPGIHNQTYTVKGFLEDRLGMEYDFLPWVAVVHVGFVVLFFFIFSYGIKSLNFQKR